MKRAAVALCLLLLAGCVTQQEIDMADDQECQSLGFQLGTEAYGDCRLRLKEIRARERQAMAIEQAQFNSPFWGWGPWYRSPYY